jgi:hypothetical protein
MVGFFYAMDIYIFVIFFVEHTQYAILSFISIYF